jgi:hypothetical protein
MNITLFNGFTGTLPEYQATNLLAEEVQGLMAGHLLKRPDKSKLPYATPILFEEGPFIGRTAERMLKHGLRRGVQRSASHAQNCEAQHLVFDFDELSPEDTQTVLGLLKTNQGFAYSSFSHGKPEKVGDSFRLVLFLDEPVHGIRNYQLAWRGVEQTYFPGLADTSSSRPYQMQGVWGTEPARVSHAWRKSSVRSGTPLSTAELLQAGQQAIDNSPFGGDFIIGNAAITCVEVGGLDPAIAMPPVLETQEQNDILNALCMIDSASTELLIRVFGCLRALGDEYQGHLESWVASNPAAVEKYRRKHPTKYDPRVMWTQGWRPTISRDVAIASIKSLARSSAFAIIKQNTCGLSVDLAFAYLQLYHAVWLFQHLDEIDFGRAA